MLKEEFLSQTAAMHAFGTRFLRDCALSLAHGLTMQNHKEVFMLWRISAEAEELITAAFTLGAGLTGAFKLSRFCRGYEDRMRLLGADISELPTKAQLACERTKQVKPGTRGDIYNGFTELSLRAGECAERFIGIALKIVASVKEGKTLCVLPVSIMSFMVRLCSDYSAACSNAAKGERSCLLKRPEEYENLLNGITEFIKLQGACLTDTSPTSLLTMSVNGLLPGVPSALIYILAQYEALPDVYREQG